MGLRKFSDFILDSNGYCFFCLNQISQCPPIKLEPGKELVSSLFSLQNLSSYLDLDMSKVFNENVPPNSQIMAMVKLSRLKASLCESCGSIAEAISRTYQKLEKLQLEMTSHVNLIHEKLLEAEKAGLATRFHSGSDSEDGLNEKLRITDRLRKETVEKCLLNLDVAKPRIRIQKLRMDSGFNCLRCGKLFSLEAYLANHQRSSKCQGSTSSQLSNGGKRQQRLNTNETELNVGAHCEDSFEIGSVKVEPTTDRLIHCYDDAGRNSFEDNADETLSDFEDTPCNTSQGGDDEEVQRDFRATITPQKTINPETGMYKCLLCGKEFQNKHFKRHHENVHMGIRFKCRLCNKIFSYKHVLQAHLKEIHSQSQQSKVPCTQCEKVFSRKRSMWEHVRKVHLK